MAITGNDLLSKYEEYKKKKKSNTEKEERPSSKKITGDQLLEKYETHKRYSAMDTSGVDDNYINTFVSDANSFLSGAGNFSIDYDSAHRSLSDLGSRYDTLQAYFYKNRKNFDDETYGNLTSALGEFRNNFDSINKFYSQFDSADSYNSWYENYKAQQAILNSEDFKEYSQIGASIENPSYNDATGWLQIGSWKPFAKDIGNIVTFSRDNIDEITKQIALSNGNADMSNILGDYRYQYMDDDEVSIYNYYLGKGETEKAAEYLASLDDTLNQRWSGKIADRVSGNALSEIFFAAGAGLDQFVSGVKNLDNFFTGAQGDAPTVTQYASSQIRSELDGFMGGVYDLTQTTANMLPSILVGSITGGVGGALTMGAGVVGNAYSEMRTLGYDEWQSRGYALLSGAAETTLQYALGGISPLGSANGGVVSKVVTKALGQVDNAIARVAIELGANMIDEGLEEAVQSILEPIFKTILTGDNYDIDWGEVAYSALLGSLSAGLLEGGPTIAGTAINSSKAKNIYGNNVKGLVTKSLEIDAENAHAQRMQARLDKGKNVSGYQINRLLDANESALHEQDVSAIRESVTQRLTELGEAGNISAIAEALTKQAQGEKLTRAEKQIISSSKFGQRVANEFNPDNIQSGMYSSAWAEKVSVDRTSAYQDYERFLAEFVAKDNVQTPAAQIDAENDVAATADNAQEAQTIPATENATAQENAAEATIEASTEVTQTEESDVTLESASKKYGTQAGAMISTYTEGQDVAKYDEAYQVAYGMGKSGVSLSYAMNSEATAYLTEKQRELAHAAGADAATTTAKEQDAANKAKANGKTGRRKGTVKGQGVTISDLKSTFNDTQNTAYKLLSTYAEATGIDIVLFKSEPNADGVFAGAQGKFKWSEDTIYIDINAGLADIKDVNRLAKYTMIRTFSHEFCHFIEKWNPIWYNEFRKVVFDTLTERGEKVDVLISSKMDRTDGMDYDAASREVVAEAMTDILPDANFVEELATKHKNIFEKLFEKLKEFVAELKAYFNSIGYNPSREANALKEQIGDSVKYVENIVKLFDKVALEAVENYKMTVAIDEVIEQPAKVESKVEAKPTVTETAETVTQSENSVDETVVKTVAENENSVMEKPAEVVSKTENTTLEEREKEYKKKYAPWLKRASRRYIFNHNGMAFLSDGSFAMGASEDMIGFARLEYSGTIYEMDLPPQIVETLDNATTPLTNAPLEGTLGDKSVYVFDLDGKTKAVFDKKYLSKLDGNLFYIGNYMKNFKILKAVDADANVVGFLLPMKADNNITNTKPSKLKSFSNKNKSAISKEVKPDVENADNRGTIQQPEPDRSGDTRVLDEPQTEDVPGDVQRGDAVGDSIERGQEIGRDDVRSGVGEQARRGSSEGDRQSGDIRRNDELTPEAEKLHEEVTEQVAQQSTEQPKGRNFVIGDSLDLPNGEKSRYKANIEAIRLVKQLESESRYATEAEQAILSKYVGWGGLANAFDERKAEWAKEFKELKELLTDEEYSLARGSTLNAHYTDISVIKAMYDGLAQLGFNGGRMLEPSSGVGNFVGAMPTAMTSKVKSWTMVELDGITGLIAKHLYPNADVRIQGFEKANIPDNYMDVAISNVPFGNYAITDKAYPKKVTSAIHNYFFAKSLDKVRPGGIVMFITSSYTMNSRDNTVRRYIMQKADLLGAIRLPDSAFKGNAGTEVVTDILILKKRAANTPYAGEDFLEAPWTYPVKGNYSGANINIYFENHPEMVLGTAAMDGGMYRGGSLTYKALEGRGSLADQIREAFSRIEGKMEYPATLSREKTNFAVERASKKTKENGLVVKDGKVYQNKGGELVEINKAKGAAERISSMLEIRDAARNLINYQQQGLNDAEIKKARTALNKVYDAFVKKYGFINSQANRNAFIEDPDRYSLFALENWNPETKKATKADIFSKNTITPNRTVTSAKDVADGLIVSVNQTGGVDTALIARITGKTEADVTRELIDSRKAFKNRNGDLETAETYLSGNVRAKLRDAEALVPLDSDYKNNVEALKSVMPDDVGYQDIFVNPGTPWIPNSVYSDFAAYMLGGRNSEWRQDVDVTRNRDTGNFTVELKGRHLKMNSANTQKWGTSRRTFLDLFDAMLNSKSVVIKDKLDDGSFVVNKDATAAANEKIENIQKEFQDWLWRDEARRGELAKLYNEVFNSVVTPKYNGENLTVNGMNAEKSLRPHQKDAVQRVISSGGNTLLAHRVGAGKTFEMAASAMKLKELGLVKKPMFAVPKSLVAQWGKEFMDIFPTAKLLVAEASDFTAANRKVFMNRIANGEYDAVIVSYEQFEKLPMSDDFTRQLYQEQIDSVIAAIEEAKADKGDKALSVKDLEKKRKSLQAKIDKLTDKAKDEGNIDFEQLGVDSLFVDEAHNFKNLFYTTSMTNVAGLGNKDGSKRAFDLYTKVRYLQQLNGGRGIVFATATPVMNSMSEMYIMQKYLQPDLLNQLGLSTFDAWAKQFGEVVNGVEIKPSGQGYRVKQSFSRFKNMSELQLLFRNFADVLTDVPGLKIPTMKGGKVNVVVCEPGQFQRDYMKALEQRADNIKNVDPSEDNMLKITSDGRKISYTQRMIDPSLPYEDGCKIYRCADNVLKEYNESKSIKGTQLIFCDMATPKGSSNNNATATEDIETDMESAQLYDDLKTRLRQGGIPAKEIAFIHEADTDAKKKKLFDDVNEGKVRVLIGSTGKMGVGMNAQKRIVAIHHLDAPWRPGDVEQRDGRAFRQKNINEEVSKYTYVTEGSFDARLWDILDRKQNFINQVMNGENVGRETEDTGEVTLSAAEVKALASGSPLIMEQVELDTAIKKLESLYRAHISAVRSAKERLSRDNGQIASLEKQIANGKADIAARKDTYSDEKFSITVGNKKYTDKKEAGVALMAEATARATFDSYNTIGIFAGFELRVIKSSEGINGLLVGKQGYPFKTYSSNTTFMISQLAGVAESIDEKVKLWQHNLTEVQKDIAEQEKLIAEPFAKQAELDQKRARYNEVMEILNPKEEQSLDSVAEDTVQEQSREYLKSDEQEQQRTNTLTDREILQIAANNLEATDMTEAERDALRIFKDRLTKLENLQDEREEQGRLYKEQQFTAPVDRKAAEETRNRMAVLDEQIKKAEGDILSLEDKKVFGNVLKKAKKVVEVEQRKHDVEVFNRHLDRIKNSAAIKKYRERIKEDVTELTNWVLKPNNKDIVKHIPDALKNTVIPFLSSIDFTSKQQLRGGEATKADAEFVTRLNALKSALKQNIDVDGMYSGYNDLPPNFMEKLQSFIDDVQKLVGEKSGEFVINKMTSEELKELSSGVRVLKAYITQINKFHANAMYQHVYNAGDNSIEALSAMSSDDGKAGGVSNFVFWQQIRPAFAFERFGNGGVAIYDSLRRGQAQLAFNTQKIVEFAENTYATKEVNAWEKEIKEINLGGKIVKMRVSDIMSFYELSKQPDSLRHMLGEGFRVATYTLGGKKISDNGHTLTEQNIADIVNSLTPRQKEIADALQKFMQEQGGAWGNYVSIKRFGEELFTNEQYFPINSDGRHLQSTADEQPSAASLYALLNMSFTKSRNEKANNRIVVYSIFDVFSNHMASMAQYNAMALPVLDAIKWFNYQQKTEDADGNRYVANSVREQMSRVYGVPEESRPGSGRQGYAETFVLNILKAFNGTEAQGIPTDTIGMNATRRYNMAQVAYNLRVVVQQPLAITRAALLIDYGSIMKGLKLRPSVIKQNIEEMRKYSGIAAWKSLGFYDVNISRGLTDTIKHKSTVMDKIGDVGMWGAEQADTLTWAAMWSACKAEVQKKQNLKPGDEGFYESVTKVFEDVIYKTQVVDSVLTKNEFLRSKGAFARLVGSFMSEPTTTASMVIDAVDKYNADLKRGMTRSQAWDKNKRMIGRTVYSYAVSAVILAGVQAVADAMRDDDDYETFIEKWLEAFGGNVVDEIMPINKLPILADFYDLAKELISIFGVDTYGNPPQSVFMQWYDSLVNGVEILYDKISGEDTNYTWYGGIYKLLQAVSGMAGLPMAAATREIITAWNNIVGAMAPSLKVKTYDPGDKNEIKYAYQDGYLTFEEAVAELIEQELVDNEYEAYFTVSGWEAGDGYSRYDSIYDAVRNGGDLKAAMADLTSHGYTEKDIYSKVKSKVGEWYRGGEVSKAQAMSMLEKYTDMDSDEITEAVNKWSAVVVTGIEYDDIGDEFTAGNITASRAIEMYMRYGGMTKEKAAEKVSVLSFVMEHPNLEEISSAAVNAYTTYCEPYGIEAEVFYDIWQYNSSVSADVDASGKAISGSKKAKVLAYINSMSLSARQKDSLYYAFGWAQSTINEAPWH